MGAIFSCKGTDHVAIQDNAAQKIQKVCRGKIVRAAVSSKISAKGFQGFPRIEGGYRHYKTSSEGFASALHAAFGERLAFGTGLYKDSRYRERINELLGSLEFFYEGSSGLRAQYDKVNKGIMDKKIQGARSMDKSALFQGGEHLGGGLFWRAD